MELKDLLGEHLLSGFDTIIETLKNGDDKYIETRFVLDDVTYKAMEDTTDSYRSFLRMLGFANENITNSFPPQKVIGEIKEDRYGVKNIIEFTDSVTNRIVLVIRCDNTNNYYPNYIIRWYPKNLAININR